MTQPSTISHEELCTLTKKHEELINSYAVLTNKFVAIFVEKSSLIYCFGPTPPKLSDPFTTIIRYRVNAEGYTERRENGGPYEMSYAFGRRRRWFSAPDHPIDLALRGGLAVEIRSYKNCAPNPK